MAGGIPTAEQEALQAPAIDPVWFSALATTLGPFKALQSLANAALLSSLGSKHPMTGALPAPPISAVGPLLSAQLAKMLKPFGISVEQAMEDEPDLFAMMKGGKQFQTIDNLQRQLKGAGSPYPGAEIARPLGIAALIDQMRGSDGSK